MGKPYTIGAQWPDEEFARQERKQYPDRGQLTNGRLAQPNHADPGWVGFLRQYGRSVVVDLGEPHRVREVSVRAFQNLKAGIQLPSEVRVYMSLDGRGYELAGIAFDEPGWYDGEPRIETFSVVADGVARFVRIQFVAKVYAFLDSLNVYGERAPESADLRRGDALLLQDVMGDDFLVDPQAPECGALVPPRHVPRGGAQSAADATPTRHASTDGFLRRSDPEAAGVNHMQLVYTGAGDEPTTWTVADFRAMVAACDNEGKARRWLMDSTLFLPHQKMPVQADAWRAWLDDLFAPGQQLAALNEAVAAVSEELGDSSYRHRVILTLPGMAQGPKDFGPLAPHTPRMNVNAADVGHGPAAVNKRAALRWLLDEMVKRMGRTSYDHLEWVGLYWKPESIDPSDPYDPWLARSLADDVHAHDLKLFWIPFYGATGIPAARSLGFDVVLIQPNVSFHWDINPRARLEAVAKLAKQLHMGVEMELHWDILNTGNPSHLQVALSRYE
ncbi:MAG: DUF4855 domain-containing protein, partial [Firmicutes bacterium]|nr:DUF4855 domain-containing protein [Bacillota bacterium]